MNIAYIDYSIYTKSIDIFFAGCNKPYCEGCCNPELIDFNNGIDWEQWLSKVSEYCKDVKLVKNIFLVGGSPNHQDMKEMHKFLTTVSQYCPQDIWLFAREDLKGINQVFKSFCSYIKCGAYIPELHTKNNIQYGIKLATSNQKIYKRGKDY